MVHGAGRHVVGALGVPQAELAPEATVARFVGERDPQGVPCGRSFGAMFFVAQQPAQLARALSRVFVPEKCAERSGVGETIGRVRTILQTTAFAVVECARCAAS